jgi:integrase/recombinase XerD
VSAIEEAIASYLEHLAVTAYATTTITARRYHLAGLEAFLAERDVTTVEGITPALLASYQRQLYLHRTVAGAPLSFRTQAQRLIAVKAFLAHLAEQGLTPYDLGTAIALPKAEHRLPDGVLSAEEAEAVLAVPDTTTVLGLRDRAMLEVLYSSANRRAELLGLRVHDVDFARGSLFVRQGKGSRDRHVPVGSRALVWLRRYLDESRPQLLRRVSEETLFLSSSGGGLAPDVLSRTVSAYVRTGAPGRHGSCHLFRHSTATLMLDAGADVRYVNELLGHRKLDTTMLYTRVSIAKLRQVHAACHPAERAAKKRRR